MKTTGSPLRIDTTLAPGTATVLVALRSRKVGVSTSHLPGPAICRGSLSINEVDLRAASIRKKQSRRQSQCEFRERLLDGFPHVAMVCTLVLLTSTGFISCVVLSVSALTRRPTLKSSLLISSGAGVIATVLIIGWLVWR